jgi:hypothetical protein
MPSEKALGMGGINSFMGGKGRIGGSGGGKGVGRSEGLRKSFTRGRD